MAISISELGSRGEFEVPNPFDHIYFSIFGNHHPRRFSQAPFNIDLFARSLRKFGKVIGVETAVIGERSIPDQYMFDENGFTFGYRGTSTAPPLLRTRDIPNPFEIELTPKQRMDLLFSLDRVVQDLLASEPFLMPAV